MTMFSTKGLTSDFLNVRSKWCLLQVIGFLAFGRMFKDVDIVSLLARWVPNYRVQF